MKQIIVRILAPQVPVYDIQTGAIDETQGQFVPDTDIEAVLLKLAPAAAPLVRYDSLLGGKAFITLDNLGCLFSSICTLSTFVGMDFFPNFVVLKLNDDGTKKEEESR